jgi:hypothetical protein
MIRFAALLVCSLCVAGCKQDKTMTTLGGVDISVDGAPKNVKVVDDTARIEVDSGKYDVSAENGRLKINGRDYETVTEDDQVKVAAAEITINGNPAKSALED